MEFYVKVRKVFDDDTALKAICSVTLDGAFVVHNLKVVQTRNRIIVAMPYEMRKDADGKEQYRDVFHPVTSEARKAMEEAVLSAYEARLAEEAEHHAPGEEAQAGKEE